MLIDCENVPAARARDVLAETARHGTLSIKRAHGDFTAPHLTGWHRLLPELAIQPVQGFPFTIAGKNGSDASLIVDAMDLLYATATDVFCIVSSDSDLTRLATRLRESGKRVYGIGARTAAVAFRNACDRYTHLVPWSRPGGEHRYAARWVADGLGQAPAFLSAAAEAYAADVQLRPSMARPHAGASALTGRGPMTQTAHAPVPGTQRPPTVGERLSAALPGTVSLGVTDRLKMAHDASHYLLTPQAVVAPTDAAQVATVMRVCAELGAPLTFRAGGTSLSGQSVTDSVLVDVRRHFGAIEVLDHGARVRVGPGAVLRQVNLRLAPYGRRLGPDPASEAACTMGGVIANNSSGMTCGTEHNTYRTLESVVAVLPSGTTVDTGVVDADERLRVLEPELHAGLLRLRDRVRSDPASLRTIQHQFSLKNTMGYGLNSFLDHDSAVAVLTHLLVGSEGTLAFVAGATFTTLPVRPHAATALLTFADLHRATTALPEIIGSGPAAIELFDATSLRVAQGDPLADAALRGLRVESHAALLVEWQSAEADELTEQELGAQVMLAGLPLVSATTPSRDAGARKALWTLRKNLYPAVAGARPSGTTALLEDIAVPPADLATTCDGLATLFARHGYTDNVIFGHAKDGNIHFMLTERFVAGEAPDRFEAFTEDMVDLVLGRGGTLKAEHGTGRVMAPYVARQYGDELYDVMCEVKRLFDPGAVLNPGIVVGAAPGAHLEHLKIMPSVDAEVDRCTECGYCEPVCPSRELTTTPRQRIVLRREQAAAEAAGDTELLARLREDYEYEAVQTCAVDGMCATACPVTINTGDLVKRLRAEAQGSLTDRGWRLAATHWGTTLRGAALGLDSAALLPAPLPEQVSRAARAVVGDEHVPRWERSLPAGGSTRRPRPTDRPDAVYLPSCQSSMFAAEPGADGAHAGVVPAVLALAERAGVALVVPEGIADHCCGTPWSSKGLTQGYDAMTAKVRPWLLEATDGGRLPVVSDSATCSEGWTRTVAADGIRVVDAVVWVATEVLPTLPEGHRLGSLALHPTCSSVRAGLDVSLRAVAARVAHEVVVPDAWGCCGFAGDRGMLHPELTASATRAQAAEITSRSFDAYASVNRTCEIGMSRATGQAYVPLLELLERVTRGYTVPLR